MNVVATDKSKLAKSGAEYLEILASDADWIVRTAEDLRQLRSTGYAPLAKLPQGDFDKFIEGLAFNKGGVADGSYKPLMSTLTITEIFEVFESFGMDATYARGILEAKCEGGNWNFDFWSFCSSACAHATKEQ